MPSEQKVCKILVNNSICANNVVDAQYVKVFLHSNDKPVFGLVDTGAGTSVGNPQLLAKLPSDTKLDKSEYYRMTTVNGGHMDVWVLLT